MKNKNHIIRREQIKHLFVVRSKKEIPLEFKICKRIFSMVIFLLIFNPRFSLKSQTLEIRILDTRPKVLGSRKQTFLSRSTRFACVKRALADASCILHDFRAWKMAIKSQPFYHDCPHGHGRKVLRNATFIR